MDPNSIPRIFNYAEAGLWGTFGFALLAVFARSRYQNTLVAALLFLVFGVTDLIEVHTGAWWRPIGLLIAKIGIVAGLLFCLVRHFRHPKPPNI